MSNDAAAFWQWVEGERQTRALSWRAIERLGGVSNGKISHRAALSLPPTVQSCRAIAVALQIPLDQLLRRAGILPSLPDTAATQELLVYLELLSPDNRAIVAAVARALAEQQMRQVAGAASGNALPPGD